MNPRREQGECTRRGFLAGSGAAGAAAMFALPQQGTRAQRWLGPGNPTRDTLVYVFMRGAADGLTTVVPYGDPDLYTARPNLAIPPPGQPHGAVDLDGFFGLAPAAAPLLTPWNDGKLLIVHASGSPDETRSHFWAMDMIERGVPDQMPSPLLSGYLARHLQQTPAMDPGAPMRGMVAGSLVSKSLALGPNVLGVADPVNFGLVGSPATEPARVAALQAMYAAKPPPLGTAALNTFDTIGLLAGVDFGGYVPGGGAVYPATAFGQAMLRTAAIIKAQIGVEIIEVDLGGWDMHSNLGPIAGKMANLMDELSRTLEAFYLDMGAAMDRVTLVAMSEFGRRVAENGSAGLDHGRGGAMLIMGGAVDGGQVFTNPWPTLAPASLHNGEDLEVTTDYRDVMAEVLVKRLGNTDPGPIFPNYTPTFHNLVSP